MESKFKVGDHLWCVDDKSIYNHRISMLGMDELIITSEHYGRSISNYHTVNLKDIDKETDAHWYSTPELAAKRFLELNKCN